MNIDQQTITFILGIAAIFSIVFNAYNSFRRPQVKNDQDNRDLQGKIANLEMQIKEIKETHLRTLEAKIETLSTSVAKLSETVIRLTTIIDERIPKGSPNLTPPGK